MKALTLWQPWASLIAHGVKTIETRSWPAPSGLVGERIAIHAAARPVKEKLVLGSIEAWPKDDPKRPHPNHPDGRPARLYRNNLGTMKMATWWALPLGAVVASARLVDCVPMASEIIGESTLILDLVDHPATRALLFHESGHRMGPDVSDQIPYGDFAPGRWAWLLDDVKPLDGRDCHECRGTGRGPGLARKIDGIWEPPRCPWCGGFGRAYPIPAKGRQGVWEWTPDPEAQR